MSSILAKYFSCSIFMLAVYYRPMDNTVEFCTKGRVLYHISMYYA